MISEVFTWDDLKHPAPWQNYWCLQTSWCERKASQHVIYCSSLEHVTHTSCSWQWLQFTLVNDWSQSCLNFPALTITRHPLSPLQSSQSLLKGSARQSMSATLKHACCRLGCVVMTPATLYQLLAKGRVSGWVTPKTGPMLSCWRGSPWQTWRHRNMKHHMSLDTNSIL